MECLDDKDDSIRLRALDLISGMVSSKNLVEIVRKLMAHMDSSESAGEKYEIWRRWRGGGGWGGRRQGMIFQSQGTRERDNILVVISAGGDYGGRGGGRKADSLGRREKGSLSS